MLQQQASRLGINLHFLDKSKDFPAGQLSPHFTEGDFNSFDDVLNFGKSLDVISIEIEHVNVDALQELEEKGVRVIPTPSSIRTIKDKGLQKQFYADHGLPTSEFKLYASDKDILRDIEEGSLKLPFVQKSRTAGYDGKGVQLIRSEADLKELFPNASLVESLVDINKELALIVARDQSSNIRYYDPVEMVFDDKANLLDFLLCPAEIEVSQYEEMKLIAEKLIKCLDYTGLLAIEFFLDSDNKLLINEIAPRTHNSGHHGIDACTMSQFETQLHILLGLDIGDVGLKEKYAGIVNIVGASDSGIGKPVYYGLNEILSLPGVFPHIYGKLQVKPFRKMGHVNIVAASKGDLLEKINIVKQKLSVRS